jgi:sarcosine oxidase, subunit gamma
MTHARLSPLHDRLARLHPVWGEFNGMPVPLRLPNPAAAPLQLADVSALSRIGLKGPRAVEWLRVRGVAVPERPNTWSALEHGGLIARLGRSEFLIEDGRRGSIASSLVGELVAPSAGVYPVLRQDAALLLRGKAVHELFAQTCNIHFQAIPRNEQVVVMTMMVGVAVTVIPVSMDSERSYRIWCDGTFAVYLWDTLLEIAIQLGGGAAGLADVLPPATPEQ